MVMHRVRVKDPQYLHSLIIAKYGSIKKLSMDSRVAESTLHRILKSGRLSYYAANRLASLLDVNYAELFEIINIKE